MHIELVDQIASRIEGAPPKFIGLREDGLFGLVKAPPLVAIAPLPPQIERGMTLSALVDMSRAVVAGDARTITLPNAHQDLAVGVLALAAQLGRLSMMMEAMDERLADLEGEPASVEEAAP